VNYNQLRVEEFWPSEFRWVREQFLANWRKWTDKDQASYGSRPATTDGALQLSPRFFVTRETALVETAAGIGGWKSYIAPTLDKMTSPGKAIGT
jgi:hypothetical protein